MKWFSPPLQTKIKYRKGDTLLAVPAKSGTTWTMNIFHQLRTGGDPDFKDIYAEVPWSEFKERPDQPDEELLERWEKMPAEVPRAFKTHSQPGPEGAPVPEMGCFATYREDLKYVVIMRNPEARASPCSELYKTPVSRPPHISGHSADLRHWSSSDHPVASLPHGRKLSCRSSLSSSRATRSCSSSLACRRCASKWSSQTSRPSTRRSEAIIVERALLVNPNPDPNPDPNPNPDPDPNPNPSLTPAPMAVRSACCRAFPTCHRRPCRRAAC